MGIADEKPNWSPDGRTIVFNSNRDFFQVQELYLMNADGSNQRRLTYTDSLINVNPAYSPDGRKIAFRSNANVAVIDADGTNFKVLSAFSSGGQICWSPDGSQLAFSDLTGIFIINSDGSGLKKILADLTIQGVDWSR